MSTLSSIPPRRALYRRKRVLLWLRRLHLYAGLFLVPWVFLYGCAAFLFNHPGLLHPRTVTHFGSGPLAGSPLAAPPEAEVLARRVAAALPGRFEEPTGVRWVGRYRLRGKDEHSRWSVRVDPLGRGGTVYATPADPEPRGLATVDEVDVAFPLDGETDWSSLADALELDGLTLTDAPLLMFDVADGEERWRLEVDPLSGELSAEPLSERPVVPTARSLITNLHTVHGYPGSVGVRWLWSLIVDVMALAMITWGLTGLVMAWQLKRLRRIGVAVVSVGVGTITLLAVGLYAALGF